MAQSETLITKQIVDALGHLSRLYRNHVGTVKCTRGRWHTFGLGKGSSDLIGYTPTVITENMVGKKVAVFTAIEVKTKKKGSTTSEEQELFIHRIRHEGGIAGVARCAQDAYEIINRYKKNEER